MAGAGGGSPSPAPKGMPRIARSKAAGLSSNSRHPKIKQECDSLAIIKEYGDALRVFKILGDSFLTVWARGGVPWPFNQAFLERVFAGLSRIPSASPVLPRPKDPDDFK